MSFTQDVAPTPDGFIVGADPKTPPRTAGDWAEVQQETMAGGPQVAGTPVVQITEPAPTQEQAQEFYTRDDLQRVRREEKDKLYERISTMDEQLKALQAERDAAEAAAKAEAEAAREKAKREEEEKMEVRDLLVRKEQEWTEQLSSLEQRYEQDRAVFEMERRLQMLETYKQERIAQESEYVMPELRDLITGSSEGEIDASIEQMKQRTAAIVSQIANSVGSQRQDMRGAAPTAPPVGPMEQLQQYETLTPDDIRTMDMETYKKHRATLMQAASRTR